MNDYDPNKESLYLIYWDINNWYGWAMSQKMVVEGFKWGKGNVMYLKELLRLHEKLECDLYNKKNYVFAIKALKQEVNHGLKLKKVLRVIKFCQETWLKQYINITAEVRIKTKSDFEKGFFKLMNNSVFRKSIGSVRKHRHQTSDNWQKTESSSVG